MQRIISLVGTLVFTLVLTGCGQAPQSNLTLNKLQEATGLAFSEITKTEINWNNNEPGSQNLGAAVGFTVAGITKSDFEAIQDFFLKSEFKYSKRNAADGPAANVAGYQKETVVCKVTSGVEGYENFDGPDWEPADPNKFEAEVKCGLLE